jgi:hypothetical protein
VVLIDPDPHLVGEKTLIIPGQNQDPLFVHDHLPTIDKALKSAKHRRELPASIAGFWKADLLIGNCKEDVWLGATVKSNRTKLEKAPGLAVGIIPSRPGTIVVPQWNPQLEMWVVEVPYDNAFMELFSCSWRLVTEFLKADAKVPKVVTYRIPKIGGAPPSWLACADSQYSTQSACSRDRRRQIWSK